MIALSSGTLFLALTLTRGGSLAKPGQITGLNAVPGTAPVASTVSITIAGTGSCGELSVGFGDRQSVTLSSVALPQTVTHAYPMSGTYILTATGTGPNKHCTGSAGTTVKVTSYVEALCSVVDCEAIASALDRNGNPVNLSPGAKGALAETSCHPPQITGVLLGSLITPGGPVILKGCGFHGSPEVRLVGQFPGGFVRSTPTSGPAPPSPGPSRTESRGCLITMRRSR